MEVMKSEKGKSIFVVGGYKFRFHKHLMDGIQRWACTTKTCKCYLKIDLENKITESFQEHTHARLEENIINRQKIANSVKRKAAEDISCRPSKLLQRELTNNGDVETLSTGDVELIKRVIRRSRESIHPSLPKSRCATHRALQEMEIVTNTGEDFLMMNDPEKGLVCFSTMTNLKILCETPKLYVDGTFKSCPKFFKQIFTIHGYVKGMYVPLVFFLLPDKDSCTYTEMFKSIVAKCESHNLSLDPEEMFMDFESAIHGAAKVVWPSMKIKGCRFHLGQNWWKKIQALGLSSEYKSNTETSRFLKLFFGLPFLSPDDIDDCFTDDLMALQPDGKENIRIFTDYVFDNYISPDATFPPRIWADFSVSTNRTTNNCESFHARLNAHFYTSHPNIYNVVDVLKNFQADTYIKLRSKENVRKYKRIEEKEMYLREQMNKFTRKTCSRIQYVEAVCMKFLPIK